MPLLDALQNIYGNGGAGDPLIGIGMGLLSRRGGEGLAQGFQNVAAMTDLSNQRRRQNSLDKLAQDRETRQQAWQEWQQKHQLQQDAAAQSNADRSYGLQVKQFDANQAHQNQPSLVDVPQADGTTLKQWITPGGVPGAAVGAPVKQRTPATEVMERENAQFQARKAQGAELGLQGDDLTRFAATGQLTNPTEKVTNDQANAALFSRRMAASNDILSRPEIYQSGTGWGGAWNKAAENIPLAGNAMVSKEYQQNRQAQEDFINSVLRRESGAAISSSEYDHANRQYFPQPGDSPEVIAQKAANRQNAMKGILGAAAPSFQKQFANERAKPQGSVELNPIPAEVLSQAKMALAKKPEARELIIQRLRENGYDPSGL